MKCRNSKPVAKFRVGDRVQFESGGPKWRHTVWGTIVEVRGPIGINGRRLYFIDVPMDPDEPLRTVMEEDELLTEEDVMGNEDGNEEDLF